jgi:hypothetical protein
MENLGKARRNRISGLNKNGVHRTVYLYAIKILLLLVRHKDTTFPCYKNF